MRINSEPTPKSVYGLTALNRKVWDWMKANLIYEDYQQTGSRVIVEWRYINAIVEALKKEGFVHLKDFLVV